MVSCPSTHLPHPLPCLPQAHFDPWLLEGLHMNFQRFIFQLAKNKSRKEWRWTEKKIKLENIISYLKPYYFCSYINERASLNTWLIFRIESDLPPTITIQYQKKSFWMEKNKRNMELILILCYTFLFHQIHDKWLFLYAL